MGPWLGGAAVEDPFDCSDNCARTIGLDRLPYIAKSFQEAAEAMILAEDAQGALSLLLAVAFFATIFRMLGRGL